ncbi:MAG: PKD domain-containing protein [Planctomycetes bacterium]|nr:PKD domain-containing protein [Planctomycetota bacterium]
MERRKVRHQFLAISFSFLAALGVFGSFLAGGAFAQDLPFDWRLRAEGSFNPEVSFSYAVTPMGTRTAWYLQRDDERAVFHFLVERGNDWGKSETTARTADFTIDPAFVIDEVSAVPLSVARGEVTYSVNNNLLHVYGRAWSAGWHQGRGWWDGLFYVRGRQKLTFDWLGNFVSGSDSIKKPESQPIGTKLLLTGLEVAPDYESTYYELALTVEGQTFTSKKGQVSHSSPYGITSLYVLGRELYVSTTREDPWQAEKAGHGSLREDEIKKEIYEAEPDMVAPNNDTRYFLPFIVFDPGGRNLQIDDNGPLDANPVPGAIRYWYRPGEKKMSVWVTAETRQGKEKGMVYASANDPPEAAITRIDPFPVAQWRERVSFAGTAADPDPGDRIQNYSWRSHRDGKLWEDPQNANFATEALTPATHVIYFKAQDDKNQWSPEDIRALRVNKPPAATISQAQGLISDGQGRPAAVLDQEIRLRGYGIDEDGGVITAYLWKDNGQPASSSDSYNASYAEVGEHKIEFLVRDKDGAWSAPAVKNVRILRTPVILIHGLLSSAAAWDNFLAFFRERADVQAGFFSIETMTLEPHNGSIPLLAEQVNEKIKAMKRAYGVKKVDLVGHNQGGLEARWLANFRWEEESIRKIAMLGTPSHGQDLWRLLEAFEEWLKNVKNIILKKLGELIVDIYKWLGGHAEEEMRTHSPFLQALNLNNRCPDLNFQRETRDFLNPQVQYYGVAGDKGPFTLGHYHLIIAGFEFIFLIPEHGDFLVAEDSVKLLRDPPPPLDTVGRSQIGLKREREVFDLVIRFLEDDPGAGPAIPPGEPLPAETAAHLPEPRSGRIFPDETQERTVPVDATASQALFTLSWPELDAGPDPSDLDLLLKTPSGQLIGPMTPGVISYEKGEGYLKYTIGIVESGDWQALVMARRVPADGLDYALVTFLDSSLMLGAAADKFVYSPGEPIRIGAHLQHRGVPLSGARVWAEIKRPSGFVHRLPLFDDGFHQDGASGDGIYGNVYELTSLVHRYSITARALVELDGKSYERAVSRLAWVERFPDLKVEEIRVEPLGPAGFALAPSPGGAPAFGHGMPVLIKALVRNLGSADADFVKVYFYDGDPLAGGLELGESMANQILEAGAADPQAPDANRAIFSVPWRTRYGRPQIHAVISPLSGFLDRDPSNNRASLELEVVDFDPPLARAGPDQRVLLGEPALLDGSWSSDNVEISSYRWDFGDGQSYTETLESAPDGLFDGTTVHLYAAPGDYTATLTVNDPAGNGPAGDSNKITVLGTSFDDYDLEAPLAEAGPDQRVEVGRRVQFNGGGSSDHFGIAGYFWDVDVLEDSDGDGVPDNDIDLTGPSPFLSSGYPRLGTFTARLAVDDAAGNGPVSDTVAIEVVDTTAPAAAVITEPNRPDGQGDWFRSEVKIALAARDQPGGAGVERIEYRLDSAQDWTVYQQPLWMAEEGETPLQYRAVDRNGNVEDPPALILVKIDRTRPATAVEIAAADPERAGLYARDDTSGVEEIYFHFDGGFDQPYDPETGIAIPPGACALYYHALDRAGNEEAENVYPLRPPLEVPSIAYDSCIPAAGTMTISWPAVTEAISYQVEVQRDGGAWSPACVTAETSCRYAVPGWNETYTFRVAACGACGCGPFRTGPAVERSCTSFRRGDADQSGDVDISDAINTLEFLYLGTGEVLCQDSADANDDGALDISDPISTLEFLFLGADPPPEPGPFDCGADPTAEDELPECAYDLKLCE